MRCGTDPGFPTPGARMTVVYTNSLKLYKHEILDKHEILEKHLIFKKHEILDKQEISTSMINEASKK